ncbi:MAG: CoA pyrophosphatase [Burkholderiales bacterium]|nr:CoA pyrophosphatase [Burkholderiales bacterium]
MTASDPTALRRTAAGYDRDAIACRLRRPATCGAAADPPLAGEPEARITAAAVLIPLVGREESIQILLTQRTEHLEAHAGQICFPGGRVEPGDASREDTALRETEEEIGLERSRVSPLGRLPDHEMPSGFRITPVVGWIEPPFALKLDPFEVAGAFEVPLGHFLDERSFQRREYDFRGRHRHYLAVPYGGRYIWGATAAMLYSLCCALRDGGR